MAYLPDTSRAPLRSGPRSRSTSSCHSSSRCPARCGHCWPSRPCRRDVPQERACPGHATIVFFVQARITTPLTGVSVKMRAMPAQNFLERMVLLLTQVPPNNSPSRRGFLLHRGGSRPALRFLCRRGVLTRLTRWSGRPSRTLRSAFVANPTGTVRPRSSVRPALAAPRIPPASLRLWRGAAALLLRHQQAFPSPGR